MFQELVRHYMGEASKGKECTKRKQIAVLPQRAAISTKCGCWLHWGISSVAQPPALLLPASLAQSSAKDATLLQCPFFPTRQVTQPSLSLLLPLTICLLMQPDGLYSPTLHAGTFSSMHLDNALI